MTFYVVTEIFGKRFMYGHYTKEVAFFYANLMGGFVYQTVRTK